MRTGTYSIVARDQDSGELGVAVQSHWFSVGSAVTWVRPGVGAAATQSIVEVAHGPDTLARIAQGHDAARALELVLERDELAAYRQLGAVDAAGRAAAHTGADCIDSAGQHVGEGFSCQANTMAAPGVPEAMASAYRSAGGDLAERLLAALEAGEAAGGDVRGRQSAALLVAPAAGEEWRTRFDIRVDDHTDPLAELARLTRFARAYEMATEADMLLAEHELQRASELYLTAAGLAPEADELTFWAGVGVAASDLSAGVELVRRAAAVNPSWPLLLERLPLELAPTATALLAALS